MTPLAISDWQLVLYAAPAVVVISLLAAAMMKWSERRESPGERQFYRKPSVRAGPSSRVSDVKTTPPVSIRARQLSGQILACPECSLRTDVEPAGRSPPARLMARFAAVRCATSMCTSIGCCGTMSRITTFILKSR